MWWWKSWRKGWCIGGGVSATEVELIVKEVERLLLLLWLLTRADIATFYRVGDYDYQHFVSIYKAHASFLRSSTTTTSPHILRFLLD